VSVRDDVEQVIRSWDAHEIARGGQPVIDYDCAPTTHPVTPAASRLEVHERLTELDQDAVDHGEVRAVIRSHLAYLSTLLGERPALEPVPASHPGVHRRRMVGGLHHGGR
jgi:hypothetical protein